MPCRTTGDTRLWPGGKRSKGKVSILSGVSKRKAVQGRVCLLYTSDAADEVY